MEFDDDIDEIGSSSTNVNIEMTKAIVLQLLKALGEDP